MNKLLEALKDVDSENNAEVNKVLQSVHCDLLSFGKRKNLQQVAAIKDLLLHFLSINEKQPYEDGIKLSDRFQKGINSLIVQADKIVFDAATSEKNKRASATEKRLKEEAEIKSSKKAALEAKKRWTVL